MSATIPVPPHPPKTVSSDPLQDEPTSYAPTTITTRMDNLFIKWTRTMDSVKQKLENPNKVTLKQFNRQLKATTPSLTASFPFHPSIAKKIKKSLAFHDVKVTSSSGTTLRDLLTNILLYYFVSTKFLLSTTLLSQLLHST